MIPANRINTKPTMPTPSDIIKIANETKNNILPTFFGFLIRKEIAITKIHRTLVAIPTAINKLVNPERSRPVYDSKENSILSMVYTATNEGIKANNPPSIARSW